MRTGWVTRLRKGGRKKKIQEGHASVLGGATRLRKSGRKKRFKRDVLAYWVGY